MNIENLSTLKIHKLTQEQYDRALAEGNIDPNAIYLTPESSAAGTTDYNELENRPVYSEVVIGDLLPETTVSIDPENGQASFPESFGLMAGREYTVRWNGTDYVCTAVNFNTGLGFTLCALGNIGVLTGGDMTEEPFVIVSVDEENVQLLGMGNTIMALDGSETVTLSIHGEAERIRKLESKYLPAGIPYAEPFVDVLLEEIVLADVAVDAGSDLVGGISVYNIPVGPIVDGNIYNVVIDGTSYPVRAYQSINNGIRETVLGYSDMAPVDVPYSDAPFMLIFIDDSLAQEYGFNAILYVPNGYTPETLAIRGGTAIRQINRNCLPTEVAPLIVTLTELSNTAVPGYTADRSWKEVKSAIFNKTPVYISFMDGLNEAEFFPAMAAYYAGSISFYLIDDGRWCRWFMWKDGENITCNRTWFMNSKDHNAINEKLDLTVSVDKKDFDDEQKAQARVNIDALGKDDVDAVLQQAKDSGAFDGADGQRGTGILKVTTAPSSYTTAIGSYTPKYRIALSTVKTQSKNAEVLLGDLIQYNYYQYQVDYLDDTYAYISATRVSIRGATGADGAQGSQGESIASVTSFPDPLDSDNNIVAFYLSNGQQVGSISVRNGDKGDKGDIGPAGSDANVTAANIKSALGYTPADAADLAALNNEIVNIRSLLVDGNEVAY